MVNGFYNGYNKAKEKYRFTEEDMRKAIITARQRTEIVGSVDVEAIIQPLSQPNTPVGFECETELVENKLWGQKGTGIYKNRTTTNSQGRTVWVGKYIY